MRPLARGELELRAAVTPEQVSERGLDRLAPGDDVVLSWAPEDVIFVRDDEPTAATASVRSAAE